MNEPRLPMTVAEAKAALRASAARSDERILVPIVRYLPWIGAGIAVVSVLSGRSKTIRSMAVTGLRMLPMLLRIL
jgi:hypothetical protein